MGCRARVCVAGDVFAISLISISKFCSPTDISTSARLHARAVRSSNLARKNRQVGSTHCNVFVPPVTDIIDLRDFSAVLYVVVGRGSPGSCVPTSCFDPLLCRGRGDAQVIFAIWCVITFSRSGPRQPLSRNKQVFLGRPPVSCIFCCFCIAVGIPNCGRARLVGPPPE